MSEWSNLGLDMEFRKSLSIVLITLNLFAFIYLLYFHYLIISYPYPIEQRDSIQIVTTNLMLSGINPYSYEVQPAGTNTYGILQSLLTLPLARIYGSNLFTHKLVVGIFMLASVGVFTLILIHKKVRPEIAISLITIFYASLLFAPIPYTRSDSIGLFFFLYSLCKWLLQKKLDTSIYHWDFGCTYKNLLFAFVSFYFGLPLSF